MAWVKNEITQRVLLGISSSICDTLPFSANRQKAASTRTDLLSTAVLSDLLLEELMCVADIGVDGTISPQSSGGACDRGPDMTALLQHPSN